MGSSRRKKSLSKGYTDGVKSGERRGAQTAPGTPGDMCDPIEPGAAGGENYPDVLPSPCHRHPDRGQTGGHRKD